jgi:histidinol-phosphate/aromatic aminotransferase/cobyric acid decarboxylase-like protein
MPGGEVYRALKQKGIRDFVRINIGTDEDMSALLDELSKWA